MRSSAARAGDALRGVSPDGPMLERAGEIGPLVGAFARAREAHGSVVAIEAASGLGKSRLLEEAQRLAAQGRMEVLSATARGLERNFSLGVARQLLEARVVRAGDSERKRLLAGAAQLAAPVLVGGLPGPTRSDLEESGPAVAHGLYCLCSNLSAARPLLLAVDDAEWVDDASLRFLLYLARRIRELPVVLIVAVGRGDPRPFALRELLADPATTVLPLRPLSAEAVASHVREVVSPRADDDVAAALHHASGGNPLLVRELVAELARTGVPPTAGAAEVVRRLAPTSLAEAVLLRLQRAGPGAVDLTRAVAVLGEAELRHAAGLADLEQPEAARLAHALAERGIFRHGEPLAFAQPVVRAAIYAHASELERAEKHRRAADVLDREGSPVNEVAVHLLEARRAGNPRAVKLLQGAAARALAEGRPDSAVRFLRRALREPPARERRARVIMQLGRAEAVAGEAQAAPRLSEALELIDDPRERALAALDLGGILHAQGRPGDAIRAFERGLARLRDTDEQLQVRLRAARAVAAGTSLSPHELESVAGGTNGGERNGRPESTSGRLLLAHLAYERALRGEDASEVRDLARRALADGALLEEKNPEILGYHRAIAALVMVEDLRTAELALTAAVEEARTRGSVLGLANACYLRAWAALRRGRIDDAAADVQTALAAGRHGWRVSVPGAHAVLAHALIERDDVAAAAREIARGSEEHALLEQSLPLHLGATGHVRLLEGRPEEALDAYLECGRRLVERGATGPGVVTWRSGAALAIARLGNEGTARRLLSEELARARAFGVPGSIGGALQALGVIDEDGRRLEYLAEAVEVFEASEATLDRARALVDLGGALRRAGKRREAREPLRRGLELAERCGASALAGRARGEIAAAGGRPRRTALSGFEALTPRERQVASLAARGMSNREIAEALFVTVKTIEWHLRHAFDKLGVSSRRELGALHSRVEESQESV
jgi:DNA-binding CsgD family transcriptional regulator